MGYNHVMVVQENWVSRQYVKACLVSSKLQNDVVSVNYCTLKWEFEKKNHHFEVVNLHIHALTYCLETQFNYMLKNYGLQPCNDSRGKLKIEFLDNMSKFLN